MFEKIFNFFMIKKQEKNDCITIISKNREIKCLHLVNGNKKEQNSNSFFSKYYNHIPSFFDLKEYDEKVSLCVKWDNLRYFFARVFYWKFS